jgi:hypothetical protein
MVAFVTWWWFFKTVVDVADAGAKEIQLYKLNLQLSREKRYSL